MIIIIPTFCIPVADFYAITGQGKSFPPIELKCETMKMYTVKFIVELLLSGRQKFESFVEYKMR